jgi:hypothetical protein
MSVDHGRAPGERGDEASVSSDRGTGVVHHPDPEAASVDNATGGKLGAKLGVVHVPMDSRDRPEGSELLEEPGGDHVARVEDQVGGAELRDAALGKRARATG